MEKEQDWFDGFQQKAAPRLREIFEKDLDGLPKVLIEKLEELRLAELSCLHAVNPANQSRNDCAP